MNNPISDTKWRPASFRARSLWGASNPTPIPPSRNFYALLGPPAGRLGNRSSLLLLAVAFLGSSDRFIGCPPASPQRAPTLTSLINHYYKSSKGVGLKGILGRKEGRQRASMAKWGEGDPRWIVEERPDATNVNNWHWTEKNASPWSKDKLDELLGQLVIETPAGKCHVTTIAKCEGEASVSNRKAKLIFFYEWSIKLEWKGKLNGADTEVEGKVEIPNLSEENSAEEVDITVLTSDTSDYALKVKEIMRTKGTEVIRSILAQYIKELKEEFSTGMILPKKDQVVSKKPSPPDHKIPVGKSATEKTTAGMNKLAIGGVKINTVNLSLKQTFKCTAEELYRALTIAEMVQAFTQGPCKLDVQKGGKFELFGGNVTGEFLNLVPNECIEQTWRFKQWPAGHYSHVTLRLDQKEDCTEINLSQKSVPNNDFDRTRDGWNHYYWESIKKTFGFGAMLL